MSESEIKDNIVVIHQQVEHYVTSTNGISNQNLLEKQKELKEKRAALLKKTATNIIIVIIISFLLYLLFK